jgi:hypothetical protein
MNQIFAEYIGQGVEIYLDDIIIHANFRERHDRIVKAVANLLVANNFVINASKTRFALNEVTLLGVKLNERCIEHISDHKEKIVNFARPKTIKEMRQFLGVANWFRQYVHNYAIKTEKMFSSLKIKKQSQWI